MDKRTIATRKKIQDAYLDMLMKKEPINVRAIVRKANINKSTFYRYYTYLEELEEELLKEVVNRVYVECANTTDELTFAGKFFAYIENLDDKSRAVFFRNVPKSSEFFVNLTLEEYKKRESDTVKQLIFYIISSGCMDLFLNRKYSREDKKAAIVELGKAYSRIAGENNNK